MLATTGVFLIFLLYIAILGTVFRIKKDKSLKNLGKKILNVGRLKFPLGYFEL